MPPSLPPPRSIISLKACPDAGCSAILIGCDCGTPTHLVVDFGGVEPVDGTEAAWTCKGCQSVRWFTIQVPEELCPSCPAVSIRRSGGIPGCTCTRWRSGGGGGRGMSGPGVRLDAASALAPSEQAPC